MNLTLTPEDLQAAPDAIKRWLVGKLFIPPSDQAAWTQPAELPAPEPETAAGSEPPAKAAAKQSSKRTTKQEPEADAQPAISREELMKRAVAVLKAKGESAIADIVKKLGIRRISECPEEKLADLLTELAVHE